MSDSSERARQHPPAEQQRPRRIDALGQTIRNMIPQRFRSSEDIPPEALQPLQVIPSVPDEDPTTVSTQSQKELATFVDLMRKNLEEGKKREEERKVNSVVDLLLSFTPEGLDLLSERIQAISEGKETTLIPSGDTRYFEKLDDDVIAFFIKFQALFSENEISISDSKVVQEAKVVKFNNLPLKKIQEKLGEVANRMWMRLGKKEQEILTNPEKLKEFFDTLYGLHNKPENARFVKEDIEGSIKILNSVSVERRVLLVETIEQFLKEGKMVPSSDTQINEAVTAFFTGENKLIIKKNVGDAENEVWYVNKPIRSMDLRVLFQEIKKKWQADVDQEVKRSEERLLPEVKEEVDKFNRSLATLIAFQVAEQYRTDLLDVGLVVFDLQRYGKAQVNTEKLKKPGIQYLLKTISNHFSHLEEVTGETGFTQFVYSSNELGQVGAVTGFYKTEMMKLGKVINKELVDLESDTRFIYREDIVDAKAVQEDKPTRTIDLSKVRRKLNDPGYQKYNLFKRRYQSDSRSSSTQESNDSLNGGNNQAPITENWNEYVDLEDEEVPVTEDSQDQLGDIDYLDNSTFFDAMGQYTPTTKESRTLEPPRTEVNDEIPDISKTRPRTPVYQEPDPSLAETRVGSTATNEAFFNKAGGK